MIFFFFFAEILADKYYFFVYGNISVNLTSMIPIRKKTLHVFAFSDNEQQCE